MEEMKIKSGQTVYVTGEFRASKEPVEAKIEKVGNKYFTLEGYYRDKFFIDTLTQANESNYKKKVYLTLQEIFDKNETEQLESKLYSKFRVYSGFGLSLDQLRRIVSIINEEEIKTL